MYELLLIFTLLRFVELRLHRRVAVRQSFDRNVLVLHLKHDRHVLDAVLGALGELLAFSGSILGLDYKYSSHANN